MRPALLLLPLMLTPGWILAAAPPRSQPAHWAFRPAQRAALPTVVDRSWCRTPIDRFVLARLEAASLRPAAPADRITLIRRLSFDLLGLPPTPAEVEAFVGDARPDAHERLVDRLLASPHVGERWGQHWLDVARFAETNGYEIDAVRPQAWRYRDWVVASLNDDLPYDQFVTRQLAGDLLARERRDPNLHIPTGFNRCGPIHQVSGNIDPLEVRHELLNEMVGGVGAAFLGLTMNCARCHDHKFDPISTTDYFRLEAFFSAAQPKEVELAPAAERTRYLREQAAYQARMAPLRTTLAMLESPYRERIRSAKRAKLDPDLRAALAIPMAKRTPAQQKLARQAESLLKVAWNEVVDALSDADRQRRTTLRRQLHAIENRPPTPPARAWSLEEGKGPLAAHVLRRGNPHRRGARVEPGFLEVLAANAAVTPRNRIDLARWFTRGDHPLTARVIVNRLWQHHFGTGLVRTPNDFGTRGDRPSHPELLDWLAVELVESGWSLKHIHRLILRSAVYQQSSRSEHADARGRSIDPNNRLLGRMNRRRLEGETLRDAILAVSGQLTPRLTGPMIRVPLEPEVYDLIFTEGEPDNLWPITSDPREHTRRSLYLFNKRNVRLPVLEAFDQPDTLGSCPVRPVSTFAPQALILLNGPLAQDQARAFAARLLREAGRSPAAQIERAYRLALARPPRQVERTVALAFLAGQAELLRERLRLRETIALPEGLPDGADPARAAALADFCLALINRNAFNHVE